MRREKKKELMRKGNTVRESKNVITELKLSTNPLVRLKNRIGAVKYWISAGEVKVDQSHQKYRENDKDIKMTRGKFTHMETRELRSARHSLDAFEGETWEKQSAERWENAAGILSAQLEGDQYVPGRNRWKRACAKTPHRHAWRVRVFKFCKCILRLKGKPTKELRLASNSGCPQLQWRMSTEFSDNYLMSHQGSFYVWSLKKDTLKYARILKIYTALYLFKEGTWRSFQNCHQEIKHWEWRSPGIRGWEGGVPAKERKTKKL